MNRQELLARWRYFHLVHGVTVRAIETLADHELDFRPRPGMRNPRELVFQIYCQEKMVAQAAHSARFTRGAWTMKCDWGALRVSMTLAPTMPPRVQFLSIRPFTPSAEGARDLCGQ